MNDQQFMTELASRVDLLPPAGASLASQLVVDAVAYGFGRASAEQTKGWWIVRTAPGWLAQARPDQWVAMAPELGMSSLRPQAWLLLIQGSVHEAKAGSSSWTLMAGNDQDERPLPNPSIGRDSLCFSADQ